MSLSGRDSIPQEGAPGNSERRDTRVQRAVRISSIVAQEFLPMCHVATQPLPPNGFLTKMFVSARFQISGVERAVDTFFHTAMSSPVEPGTGCSYDSRGSAEHTYTLDHIKALIKSPSDEVAEGLVLRRWVAEHGLSPLATGIRFPGSSRPPTDETRGPPVSFGVSQIGSGPILPVSKQRSDPRVTDGDRHAPGRERRQTAVDRGALLP
ncbi:hypothetical protein AAFF_G00092590 [Aldrovandia affinis]|uniref:Uncharacterized protein n=1 Tax=Aldrovandia affinis TaxID=143900 RepID=A0AAD7WY58_9TELE|nr:hypothetical protein AAFF_G00092590 [Aldrovandia affinis]